MNLLEYYILDVISKKDITNEKDVKRKTYIYARVSTSKQKKI